MKKISAAAMADERAKTIVAHENTIKELREQVARLTASHDKQAETMVDLRDVIAQLKTRLHESEIESARKQGYIDSVRERAELESEIVTPPSTPISRAQLRAVHRRAAEDEGRRVWPSTVRAADMRPDWWNLGR